MDKTVQTQNSSVEERVEALRATIARLKAELSDIESRTDQFESVLRSHLINEIIEEQELSVIYKQQQQAKKEKRREQKRKGKNYKEQVSPAIIKNKDASQPLEEDQAEKKRLYREAMVLVHPDKYHQHSGDTDHATDATVQLIQIYRNGTLEQLRQFHAHIVKGNAPEVHHSTSSQRAIDASGYLHAEIERLQDLILTAKNKNTYKVLIEYANPMLFLEELKAYYDDRLMKLRKRTRKSTVNK